jgi:hypothetical protein
MMRHVECRDLKVGAMVSEYGNRLLDSLSNVVFN